MCLHLIKNSFSTSCVKMPSLAGFFFKKNKKLYIEFYSVHPDTLLYQHYVFFRLEPDSIVPMVQSKVLILIFTEVTNFIRDCEFFLTPSKISCILYMVHNAFSDNSETFQFKWAV